MKKNNNNIFKKAFENIIFKIIQVILSSTKILWIYVNDKKVNIEEWHFLIIFFITFLHIYIKMPKNLSVKYYQENNERLFSWKISKSF